MIKATIREGLEDWERDGLYSFKTPELEKSGSERVVKAVERGGAAEFGWEGLSLRCRQACAQFAPAPAFSSRGVGLHCAHRHIAIPWSTMCFLTMILIVRPIAH